MNTVEQIVGGTTVSVDLVAGGTERVSVLEVRLREAPALMAAIGDEHALVALYTGKPQEWVDTITRESAERIVQEGDRLNVPFLNRWLERTATRTSRVQGLLASSLSGSPQPTPSPTS